MCIHCHQEHAVEQRSREINMNSLTGRDKGHSYRCNGTELGALYVS